ncbi:hypothetical protein BDD12DRAFT_869896 [Trichophaea hybrida]|nr:hypothetical protein BDD12DRAFT_869896 [Trichophaea hybrida]
MGCFTIYFAAALSRFEVLKSLEEALDTITTKMAYCQFYGTIYGESLQIALDFDQTTTAFREGMASTLPEFYAAVLVFSVKQVHISFRQVLPNSPTICNRFQSPWSLFSMTSTLLSKRFKTSQIWPPWRKLIEGNNKHPRIEPDGSPRDGRRRRQTGRPTNAASTSVTD